MAVIAMYKCKKCESNEYVKAGFVKGEQRYKCKKCGCQFVPTRHKGRSKQEKLLAIWMSAYGYLFRTIAKFFKVNVHSAFVRVNSFAEKNIPNRGVPHRSIYDILDGSALCELIYSLIEQNLLARKSVVTIISENADFKFKRKNGQLHVKGTPY